MVSEMVAAMLVAVVAVVAVLKVMVPPGVFGGRQGKRIPEIACLYKFAEEPKGVEVHTEQEMSHRDKYHREYMPARPARESREPRV